MKSYLFEPKSAQRFLDAYTTRSYQGLCVDCWSFGAVLNLQGRVMTLLALLKRNDGYVSVLWPQSLTQVETFLKPYLKINRALFSAQDLTELPPLAWPSGAPIFLSDACVGVFTLHDLSLDVLGWVEWTKGCYLGQEIALRVQMRTLDHKKRLAILSADFLDKEQISILYSLRQYTVAVMHRCDWEQQGVAYVWDRSYQQHTIPPDMLSMDILT